MLTKDERDTLLVSAAYAFMARCDRRIVDNLCLTCDELEAEIERLEAEATR